MNEFVLFLIALVIARSIWNLIILGNNLRWLFSEEENILNESNYPLIFLCIPALRENSVISDTILYMLTLNYPKDKLKIIITTTEKENVQKIERRKSINQIAKDLSNKISLDDLKSKYLGIFPGIAFPYIYDRYNGKSISEILPELDEYYDKYPTTMSIVEELKSKINSSNNTELVLHFHYPNNNRTVSDQINFTVDEIIKSQPPTDSIFAVYNADSRPNVNTLMDAIRAFTSYKKMFGREAKIVQQSSIFTLNYNLFPKSFSGYILRAASIYQTRWTLIHELFMFRSQAELVIRPITSLFTLFWNNQISNCVGHGMFININYFHKRGGFPTDTLNEDLPFGFYTCCLKEPIVPFNTIENSQSPESIKSLINQKSVWFNPYIEYVKCRNIAINTKQYKSKIEVDILTVKALLIGLMWFVQSLVLLLPLIWFMITANLIIGFAWLFAMLLYWYLPAMIIYSILPNLEKKSGEIIVKRSLQDFVFMVLAGTLNVLFNSLGPLITVIVFIKGIFLGNEIIKHKTER